MTYTAAHNKPSHIRTASRFNGHGFKLHQGQIFAVSCAYIQLALFVTQIERDEYDENELKGGMLH